MDSASHGIQAGDKQFVTFVWPLGVGEGNPTCSRGVGEGEPEVVSGCR